MAQPLSSGAEGEHLAPVLSPFFHILDRPNERRSWRGSGEGLFGLGGSLSATRNSPRVFGAGSFGAASFRTRNSPSKFPEASHSRESACQLPRHSPRSAGWLDRSPAQSRCRERLLFFLIVFPCLFSFLSCAALGKHRVDPAQSGPVIADIELIGVSRSYAHELRKGLETRATGPWPWSTPQRLDPLSLETDLQRIVAFYERRGLFAARVLQTREISLGKDQIRLQIRVEEGAPTVVRKLLVSGLDALDEAARQRVLADLPLKEGEVLIAREYERTRGLILARLLDEGFPESQLQGQVDVFPEKREAQVSIEAQTGPLYRVGEIEVQGLLTYPEAPVKAVAQRILKPGSKYRPQLVDDAQERVHSLDAFSGVRIGLPPEPPENPKRAPVRVVLDEAPAHGLTVGGGIGVERNLQQLQLRADYRRNNFLGGLRRLDWRNELALRFLPSFFSPKRVGLGGTTSLDLTQPELLPLSDGALRVAYERVFRQAYEADALQLSLGLAVHYRRQSSVQPSIGVQQFFGTVGREPAPGHALPLSPQCPAPCRLLTLGGNVVHDRRNNKLSPTKGWMLLAEFNWSPPLASPFHLIRVQPELRYYQSLGADVVLATRAKLGAVWSLKKGEQVPIVSRIFGGGEGGHRGFGAEQLSPVYQDQDEVFVPLGGTGLWLLTLELRARFSEKWGGAAFADWGSVSVDPLDFHLDRSYLAVGTGARYHTPAGPVRLDLAYRVDRRSRVALNTGNDADLGVLGFFSLFISLGEAF